MNADALEYNNIYCTYCKYKIFSSLEILALKNAIFTLTLVEQWKCKYNIEELFFLSFLLIYALLHIHCYIKSLQIIVQKLFKVLLINLS